MEYSNATWALIETKNIYEETPSHNITEYFNPTTNALFDNVNNYSIYFKYIKYDINKDAKTFSDLMNNSNENDIENSCYINVIFQTYENAINKLIKPDGRNKRSNVDKIFTIENLCQLCNIKYKEFSMGLSLKNSKPFFEKYRLG